MPITLAEMTKLELGEFLGYQMLPHCGSWKRPCWRCRLYRLVGKTRLTKQPVYTNGLLQRGILMGLQEQAALLKKMPVLTGSGLRVPPPPPEGQSGVKTKGDRGISSRVTERS